MFLKSPFSNGYFLHYYIEMNILNRKLDIADFSIVISTWKVYLCIFSHWIFSIENKSLSSFSLDLTKYKNKNVPCHAKLTSFGYDEKTFLSSKISHVMKVENEEQLKSYDNRTDIAIFLLKSNSRFLPSSPQKNIDSSKIVLQISQDDWSQV